MNLSINGALSCILTADTAKTINQDLEVIIKEPCTAIAWVLEIEAKIEKQVNMVG